jgi:hypothetical protein
MFRCWHPRAPDGGAQNEQTSRSGMTGILGKIEGKVERS